MKKELLESILNALPYEIVFCDRNHTIQYLNKTAKQHYGERIHIGNSIFNCHNQESKKKIMNFLEKADAGSDEMFEAYNPIKQEREFFTPVRDSNGKVIGYFERHEVHWDTMHPEEPVGEYWKRGK